MSIKRTLEKDERVFKSKIVLREAIGITGRKTQEA